MYRDIYHLNDLPFENTPNPRYFFASEQHREALAAIEYTIRMRKGIVLITGDIGSGKTTVGRTVCERCADRALIVPVTHGHRTGVRLLRQVLRGLDMPISRHDDHAAMMDRLHPRLLEQLALNRPVVLFVDEGQTLSGEALEELRLLTNHDTATQKAIQIVLVGQPELRSRIRGGDHPALRQRIVLAKRLNPLQLSETAAYIRHRISTASVDPENPRVVFAEAAEHEVHRLSGGVPRVINIICDNCLLLGSVERASSISLPMVQRVAEDLVPGFNEPQVVVGDVSASLNVARVS